MYDEIPTPAVVVELDQVTANVREMAKEAKRYGISLIKAVILHGSSFLRGRRGLPVQGLGKLR